MASKWNCDENVIEIAFWAVDNNKFDEYHNITITRESNGNKNLFCSTCKASLRKNNIPTLALKKGLHFPDKIACVDQLTRLEERLVSPRDVFQSIWPYKGLNGQYKTKGGIVNVPVTVDTSVSSLPRNYNSTGIIHVSLARKLIFNKDYIKGNVSPAKVWEAATNLQTTPLYIEYDVQLANEDQWTATNLTHDVYDEMHEETLDVNSNDTGSVAENTAHDTDAESIDEINDTEDLDETDDEPLNAGTSESILISDNDITIRLAPGEGRIPISILKDKDSDFLSFPKVYYGQKLEGSESISYSSLTKSVARRFDRRAAMRPDLVLYMDRKVLLTKRVQILIPF